MVGLVSFICFFVHPQRDGVLSLLQNEHACASLLDDCDEKDGLHHGSYADVILL